MRNENKTASSPALFSRLFRSGRLKEAAVWPVLVAALWLPAPQGRAQGGVSRLSPSDFTSATECGKCHEEIYNQWSQSMHSRSVSDPVYRAVFREMMTQTSGKQKAFCLSCHAPVASVSGKFIGDDSAMNWDALNTIESQGVTCDFCHTISGNENLGKNISVGAYVFPRRGSTAVKYGRHADAQNSNHAVDPSRFLINAEFCSVCHKFKHPLAGVEIQSTYQEWLKGPYAKEGRRCQDCHMPAYSGRVVTSGGNQRSEIHAHVFAGGRSEMLKKAVTLTVWGIQKSGDPKRPSTVDVTVNLANSGAGHVIPTGLPGLREMVLEVIVLRGPGDILGHQTASYGQRLVKDDGTNALPWEPFSRIEDNRISPRQSSQRRFRFSLPAAVEKPVMVRAYLRMMPVSAAMARRLNLQPEPPLLMTTAEATAAIGR